jgi:hypothetical protein
MRNAKQYLAEKLRYVIERLSFVLAEVQEANTFKEHDSWGPCLITGERAVDDRG